MPIELNIEKKHGKNSDLVQDKEAFQNACKEYAETQIAKQMEIITLLLVMTLYLEPQQDRITLLSEHIH